MLEHLIQSFESADAVNKIVAPNSRAVQNMREIAFMNGKPEIVQNMGNVDAPRNHKAIFDVTIKRVGTNVGGSIPAILFAANWQNSGYGLLMNAVNPNAYPYAYQNGTYGVGVGFNSDAIADFTAANSTPQRVQFAFTDDNFTNSDLIQIETKGAAPYPVILQMLASGQKLSASKLRITLSDATQLTQFQEQLTIVTGKMMGMAEVNPLPLSSQKSPFQYQNGIIDIDANIVFDGNTGFCIPIIAVNNFQVNVTLFVD